MRASELACNINMYTYMYIFSRCKNCVRHPKSTTWQHEDTHLGKLRFISGATAVGPLVEPSREEVELLRERLLFVSGAGAAELTALAVLADQ